MKLKKNFWDKIIGIKAFQLTILSQIPTLIEIKKIFKILNNYFVFLEIFHLNNIENSQLIVKTIFFKKKKKILLERCSKKKSIKLKIKKERGKLDFKKTIKTNIIFKISNKRYLDFAGIDKIIDELQELIEWPLIYSDFFRKYNLSSIRGVLFHGPPGTGKTFLAYCIAGELNLPFFCTGPSNMISTFIGGNEKKLQNIFQIAKKNAPSIIFIDEIDILIGSRENVNKDFEKKMIGQILIFMDQINKSKKKPVLIIGATNQIDFIDPALRRPGRFDRELEFKLPDFQERLKLLIKFSENICFYNDVNLQIFAKKTNGFVSGDLSNFLLTSIRLSISRNWKRFLKGKFRNKNNFSVLKLKIKKIDLDRAREKIEPSILRHGFKVPNKICWNDIGGLEEIRKILSKYVIEPIKKYSSQKFIKAKGMGFLLFGPSGCGKTLIAQVVAQESQANFIAIKGPEIYNKFLGESEKEIRSIFNKARLCAPTIIFFDEIDSLAIQRVGKKDNFHNEASDRILNQLLTEIDGISQNEGVFIIGATNRPEMIDKALLRHGRLDKLLYVSLPNRKERIRILKSISGKFYVLPYLNWKLVDKKIYIGLSGADLMAMVNESLHDANEKKIKYWLVENNFKGLFINTFFFMGNCNLYVAIQKVKRIFKKR
jgi:SpoVK/Ycf46/Vps4 family AAA+-type ATPase